MERKTGEKKMKLKELVEVDTKKDNCLIKMLELKKFFENKGFSEEEAKNKAERAMKKFETMIGNMAAFSVERVPKPDEKGKFQRKLDKK